MKGGAVDKMMHNSPYHTLLYDYVDHKYFPKNGGQSLLLSEMRPEVWENCDLDIRKTVGSLITSICSQRLTNNTAPILKYWIWVSQATLFLRLIIDMWLEHNTTVGPVLCATL